MRLLRVTILVVAILVVCSPSMAQVIRGYTSPSGFSELVGALNQFPIPNVHGYHVATVLGWGSYCDSKPTKGMRCVTLRMVTRDDQRVDIEVQSGEIYMALFLHEMSPEWGRYKYWRPVFLMPVLPKQESRPPHDLQMVGRYKTKWDRKDPNKVLGYENEIYWK